MHHKRSAQRRRGFTLVEVLTATSVMVVGLMASCYLLGLSTSVNLDSKTTTQAYAAAQQEIEELRNMPYEPSPTSPGLRTITLTASDPEARFLNPDGTSDASRPTDSGYPGRVPALQSLHEGTGGLIITNDPAQGDLCKVVTVIVRWRDKGNVMRSVMVSTNITKGGINPQ